MFQLPHNTTMNEVDMVSAESVVLKHNHPREQMLPPFYCPACAPTLSNTPWVPPCKLNVKAYKSILLHRNKLIQMTHRSFLLYKLV